MIKLNNKKGFTLIELMIVIAIIGILAAIAIPNFIAYRAKSYCSRAESDANSITAALADYFAIPSHNAIPAADPETKVSAGGLGVVLSGRGNEHNTGNIGGTTTVITVTVTDGSGRCPQKYRDAMPNDATNLRDGWSGLTHIKYMALNN
jgi:type IV pilus assembly protein PilA